MRDLSNQNWVKTERISQLADVKIYAANFAGERIVPRHVHHEYVFGLVVGGAAEIDCGHRGEKYILQPNDLLLTEAREVYSCRSLGVSPWHYLSISVPPEKLDSLLDLEADGKRVSPPHFTRNAVKNKLLRRAFLELCDSLGDERTALEQESLLLEWVSLVNKNYAEQPNQIRARRIYSETDAVRRVREYLRENAHENVKLQTLADLAGLSPYHLNRLFSAQIGLPPHKFQSQIRIEKAVNLIAQKKPLAEIAFETGFADQSHFNRFFKCYTGVTPRNFSAR